MYATEAGGNLKGDGLGDEMAKRKYPFTEPMSQPLNTSSGSTVTFTNVTMTTYKENPFHGWRRYMFAFDEWAHRHDLNDRGPLHLLCNWWDKHLLGDD